MENRDGIECLLAEHGKSIELIQHYDNLRQSLMKFAFSYHSIAAAVTLAIYRYRVLEEKRPEVQLSLSCLLVLGCTVGIAIVAMLTQNRRHFVLAARQTNAIRGIFFSRGILASNVESALPVDSGKPKMFNPISTHLMTIFLLVVINSLSLAFAVLLLSMIHLNLKCCYLLPIACWAISLILQLFYVKWSLKEERS